MAANPAVLVTIGVAVGVYSGIMGLGGGTLMIPAMVLLLGFTQLRANATSLAVLALPVMLPAVIRYWKDGNIDVRVAAWLALGVVTGSALGQMSATWIVARLGDQALKLIFGFVLVYVAGQTIFQTLGKEHLVRSLVLASALTVAAAGLYFGVRAWDGRASAAAADAPASTNR